MTWRSCCAASWPASRITPKSLPAPQTARITDEGTIGWQCRFAAPGRLASGLPPPGVARAIAAALGRYRTTGNGATRDSQTGRAVAR